MAMAALVVLLGGWPTAAHAHTDLVASTPRGGDTLTATTDQVVLVFAEDVVAGSAQVAVRGPEGGDAVRGAPEVDGSTVRVPVHLISAGPHEVSYRVTSTDGHPVVGGYSFRVESREGAGRAARGRDGTPQEPAAEAKASEKVAGTGPVDSSVAPRTGGTPLWPVSTLAVLVVLVLMWRAGRRERDAGSGDGQHLGA